MASGRGYEVFDKDINRGPQQLYQEIRWDTRFLVIYSVLEGIIKTHKPMLSKASL